jgi:ABC-type Fe3+/spermidine/putrescine transport system ATPase subunit
LSRTTIAPGGDPWVAHRGATAISVAITCRGVAKTFTTRSGDVEALAPIALEVADGEFLALIGPSGCGKTTLLRIVGGLEQATSGRCRIERASGPATPC